MRRYVNLVYLVCPAMWLWNGFPQQKDASVIELAAGLTVIVALDRGPDFVRACGEAAERIGLQWNLRLALRALFSGESQPPPKTPGRRQRKESAQAEDPPPDEPAPPPPPPPKQSRPQPAAPPPVQHLTVEEQDRKAAQALTKAVDKWQTVEERGQLPLFR